MKVVRELGLVRRNTVRILSFSGVKNCDCHSSVREDRELQTTASLGSYVWNVELLKASQAGKRTQNKFFKSSKTTT